MKRSHSAMPRWLTQWAAVITHLLERTAAPHLCCEKAYTVKNCSLYINVIWLVARAYGDLQQTVWNLIEKAKPTRSQGELPGKTLLKKKRYQVYLTPTYFLSSLEISKSCSPFLSPPGPPWSLPLAWADSPSSHNHKLLMDFQRQPGQNHDKSRPS